jgi:NADPH:quinone reductase-like Zn-dependent oxidoreductase
MAKGLYNPKLKLPRIPCSDGAGEVSRPWARA